MSVQTTTKSKTINVASLLAASDSTKSAKSAEREKSAVQETTASETKTDAAQTVSASYTRIAAYYKRVLSKSDAESAIAQTVDYVRTQQKITQREAIAVAQSALASVRTMTASALRLEASRLTQEHKSAAKIASTSTAKSDDASEQARLAKIAASNKTKSTASVRAEAQRIADERKRTSDAAKSARKSNTTRKILGEVTNGSVRIGQVPRSGSVSERILSALSNAWATRDSILATAKIDVQNDPWRQSFARLRYALRCERRVVNKTEEYRLIADALAATDVQRQNALAKRSALTSDAKSETKTTAKTKSAATVTSDASATLTQTPAQKRAATIAAKRAEAQKQAQRDARAAKRAAREASATA